MKKVGGTILPGGGEPSKSEGEGVDEARQY